MTSPPLPLPSPRPSLSDSILHDDEVERVFEQYARFAFSTVQQGQELSTIGMVNKGNKGD